LRCLWITPQAPYLPFRGGDAIYSSNLIRALAGAGAKITVVCNDNKAELPEISGVQWVVVPFRDSGRATSLATRDPSIVHRYSTPQLKEVVDELLSGGAWEALVIDTLAVAHAIDPTRLAGGLLQLVYVSHNHEESVRGQIARAYPFLSPIRALLALDAWKAASVERRLVDAADLITTASQPDADLFRNRSPSKQYVVLTPGYHAAVLPERVIGPETPRRVLLLGSYAWLAKRLNLRAFLRAAARPLAEANIGIDVVGAIPSKVATRLRAEYPTSRITGAIDDAGSFLEGSRLGLVVEAIGGGFKLKVLDYVFSRLPVLALAGSVEGTPLVAGHSILYAKDAREMVRTIVEVIDDFDRLNAIQQAAFHACTGHFEWAERGRALATAMGMAAS
jgi:glycosyltransferase involved in cell wall biosynthesis